jgi:hypothetical protein
VELSYERGAPVLEVTPYPSRDERYDPQQVVGAYDLLGVRPLTTTCPELAYDLLGVVCWGSFAGGLLGVKYEPRPPHPHISLPRHSLMNWRLMVRCSPIGIPP